MTSVKSGKSTRKELNKLLIRRLGKAVRSLEVEEVRYLLFKVSDYDLARKLEDNSSIAHLASPAVAAQNRDLMR